MASEALIFWAGLWLTVSLKCCIIYAVAWLIVASLARHRPAWRSFIWLATLASFPGLTVLEWTGGGSASAVRAAFEAAPDVLLFALINGYVAIGLVLAGLVLHSAIRLGLLRAYSAPLGVSLDSVDDDGQQPSEGNSPFLLQTVDLLRNGQLTAPTSFGILRPVIVLPEPPIGTIYRQFVRAAVLHELVKTLRFDALWTLLARVVQCVYFAHPAVWWAFRHYCLAREQVCDRWTVRTTGEVSEYEVHLLAVSGAPHRRVPMSLDMPMDATGSAGVRARIADLQNYDRPESLQPWPTVVASVVWMLLLAATASISLERLGGGDGPVVQFWPMLMGGLGALTAGAGLAAVILIGRTRRARMTPPIDGMAARSRQTIAECVHRIEREWQDLQAVISGTARRLEPLLLMFIVMAVTVGFWFIASTSSGGDRPAGSASEAVLNELRWP